MQKKLSSLTRRDKCDGCRDGFRDGGRDGLFSGPFFARHGDKHSGWCSGFSLVEMSIVLIVIGALLSIFGPMITTFQNTQKQKAMQNHQMIVKQALAAYVFQNNHLPCPQPPHTNDGVAQSTCHGVTIGKIPYKTLNISEKHTKCGSGHPMTYGVNGALTMPFMRINTNDPESDEITFCRANMATTPIRLVQNGVPYDTNGEVAFIIIAHKNGGAYKPNGTRMSFLTDPIPEQSENINDDDTFDISGGADTTFWITRGNFMAENKEVCR